MPRCCQVIETPDPGHDANNKGNQRVNRTAKAEGGLRHAQEVDCKTTRLIDPAEDLIIVKPLRRIITRGRGEMEGVRGNGGENVLNSKSKLYTIQ